MSSADRAGIAFALANWMRTWPRGYVLAFTAVCVAIAAQRGLEVAVGFAHSFLLFYPTILIVSLLAGLVPGVIATFLSAAAAEYFYWRPGSPSGVSDETERIGMALFLLVGVIISWLADSLRRRANRLQEFEKVVEGLDEMIIVLDRDYRYLIANAAFLSYRGLKQEQVIGHHIADTVDPDEFEKIIRSRLEESFQGGIVQSEMSYYCPGRGDRELLATYFPIGGAREAGRVACVFAGHYRSQKREPCSAAVSRAD